MFWTAGFDVIYSCQDYDFDRDEGAVECTARRGNRRRSSGGASSSMF